MSTQTCRARILHPSYLATVVLVVALQTGRASPAPTTGTASWYGEDHRGRLMANGKPFNPDRLTAASWFLPLGSRVQVTLSSPAMTPRSVVVTITDRGPAQDLVQAGRIIDLSHAAFVRLATPDLGLVPVKLRRLPAHRSTGRTFVSASANRQ